MSAISPPNTVARPGAGSRNAGLAAFPVAPWRMPALLLGGVLGAALQLQQPALWRAAAYGALLVVAGAIGWAAWRSGRVARGPGSNTQRERRAVAVHAGAVVAAAAAMFALCGLRAVNYTQEALAA